MAVSHRRHGGPDDRASAAHSSTTILSLATPHQYHDAHGNERRYSFQSYTIINVS
jgi:hypothetical protein